MKEIGGFQTFWDR